jgi:pimeloyl-ACP methyl ester carboxylesterase
MPAPFHIRPLPLAMALLLGCGGSDEPNEPGDDGVAPPFGDCSEGTLGDGPALYRTCFPQEQEWNGDLIIYAHGYVQPDAPLQVVDNVVGGTTVSTFATQLGYAFATTSFRANGLIADQAVEDVVELDGTLRSLYTPDPARVFLVGVSEGALVTTLAIERHPGTFTGDMAVCGPIGNFERQLDYFGDFRVVFDYFFPSVLPGTVVDIPAELQQQWNSVYVPAVANALAADPVAAGELLSVTGAPIDPSNLQTVGETVIGILWYNVFGTADAQARLGGQPYDNIGRIYQGSSDDDALDQGVARFAADAGARAAIGRFQTTGQIDVPVVTLHTTGDPIVPFEHQALYGEKVAAEAATGLLDQTDIDRYGHCTFTAGELLAGFSRLTQSAAAIRQQLVP